MKSFIAFVLCAIFAAAIVSAENLESRWHYSTAGVRNSRRGLVKAQITYYNGEDLKGSACYGRNGLPPYDAKDSDFIAAMYMDDFEHCYECLKICRDSKCVVVKVIDECGGCPPDAQNVDLTESAFKKLATLEEGRVKIKYRPIKCPAKGRWPKFESHH